MRVLVVAFLATACQGTVRVSLPRTIDYDVKQFVPALPNADDLDDSESTDLGSQDFLFAKGCPTNDLVQYMDRLVSRRNGEFIDARPYAFGAIGWISPAGAERRVQVYAVQWGDRADYRKAKDRVSDASADPCITTSVDASVLVEPLPLSGLPENAMAAVWHSADDALSVIVYDDERQLIALVAWQELPGPTPTDEFVDVVNKVWSDLLEQTGSGLE